MSIWAFLALAILFYIFKGMGWLTEENNWVVLIPFVVIWIIYTYISTILDFFDEYEISRVTSVITLVLLSFGLWRFFKSLRDNYDDTNY